MRKRGLKFSVFVEIGLIIIATFAFAHIIRSSFGDDNLVSAFTEEDLVAGVNTCLEDNNGNVCQEFAASECEINCKEDCIPSRAENIESCRLGTCYDEIEGYCLPNSPRELCENLGNTWIDDPNANVQQCRNGCCLQGSETYFVTEQQCNRRGNLTGTGATFRQDIANEWECLALGGVEEVGACVIPKLNPDEKNACKFTDRGDCQTLQGNFYQNTLCSHPDLNTECEKQVGTECFNQLDEVYWVDSCGNRENIYDSNKAKSWNSGRVLTKNESCDLISGSNFFANQENCGNCNYLLGSTCGKPTERDEEPLIGDLVCKNLECVEEDGTIRQNGESWCVYQGRIGVDGGTTADTPGSSHYRAVCVDGQIEKSLCGTGRTGICEEQRAEIAPGKEISVASCRLNQANVCLNYNNGGKLSSKDKKRQCNENPDCHVEDVLVSENLFFETCLPKYPIGFDLVDSPESAELLCNLADISCISVWVKSAEVGGKIGDKRSAEWQCVENCLCEESIFVENMHDYCISLGDCGASVNYVGDYRENYKVSSTLSGLENVEADFLSSDWGSAINRRSWLFGALTGSPPGFIDVDEDVPVDTGAPDLTNSYKGKIKKYYQTQEGEYVDKNESSEYFGDFFAPVELGPEDDEELFEGVDRMNSLKGASTIATMFTTSYLATSKIFTSIPTIATNSWMYSIGGYVSALVGAVIGFAVTSMLIEKFGLSAGLDSGMVNALLIAGTVGGGLVGWAIWGASVGAKLSTSPAWIVGIIILIIVAVTLVLLKWADVGEVERNIITFDCQPWTPIKGGEKCDLCGDDGLRCNKYACQSLGANCRFINEGTDLEACVDISPNDNTPPIISANEEYLLEGYSYTDENERGVKLIKNGGEGCVDSGSMVLFSIKADELSECRWDYASREFGDMELQFNHESLLYNNHSAGVLIPSMEAFGMSRHDPDARAEFNLYARCQDSSGNENIIDYVVSMCVKKGIDLTAPLINRKEPFVEFVEFGKSEQDISIWTNEPAECRWDDVDRNFEEMGNEMECFNDIEMVEAAGWRCEDTFPVLNNVNTYSIKCKDQPSLAGINESARNTNVQGYNITLRKSRSPLSFEVIKPLSNEIIESPTPVTSVKMELETSGGMNDKAICYYIINDHEIEFAITRNEIHKQTFELYGGGRHIFDLKCVDAAGNEESKRALVQTAIDTRPPKVTKVYNRQGMLNVVTDEDASCYYRTMPTYGINECGYKVEDAEPMADEGEVHTTPFDISKTYYIKCMDEFNNTASGCSVSLVGLEVPNV